MRILTIGDSWTIANPSVVSWPTKMSQKYSVEVVNLARSGSSNNRAARIGIEELARDPNYDYVIFPLAPAARTEILKQGKWHQIWPGQSTESASKLFTEFWHPFNDVQNTIMLSFYFIHSVKALGIPVYMTGLSMMPAQYTKELSWITDYKHDKNFDSLGIQDKEFDIGINDLDRKLKSLQAIHKINLQTQPDYLTDVVDTYLNKDSVKSQYNFESYRPGNHPDSNGYHALCDYFAKKIGLC